MASTTGSTRINWVGWSAGVVGATISVLLVYYITREVPDVVFGVSDHRSEIPR